MSTTREVTVPDVGDFKNIPVIEILVKPGDIVKVDDPLMTLESDKATMEVPAPFAGTVKELMVAIGAKVSEGTLIAIVEEIDEATPVVTVEKVIAEPPLLSPATSQVLSAPAPVPTPAPPPEIHLPAHASPSLRRFARELGVDIDRVIGTGPKGRIQREDVLVHVKQHMRHDTEAGGGGGLDLLPWPQIDFAKFGDVERMPLSRLRKISGPNLARNWVMIPHVTNFDEADVTDLETFRLKVNKENADAGIKVTMLAFLIKAAVSTLKAFPEFNSSLEGEELVLKRYYHMGFAADTPNGLVVPVIRDADKKGVLEIASEMAALARGARDGKLKATDMQGGCFSISSLGGIGGTGFTPIVNAPEVAILGAAKAEMKPLWNGSEFRPRLVLPLSLSWDHRVVDGAAAGRFLHHLVGLLGDFRRILL
ncbi:dihydrolipoyllysine-residue acetyltransferase [Parvibaculum sp.]|uniref:dihydrolipoyllysine-residue acetyltransferase n=1 Tax=Parvibaculum sp. TaxID=2024848 RepID=UPI001DCA2607|nr:dihydrolipoyllysine-residue acetyltransferase [Parvibaculum sp.]MBX3490370.1 dihydrolipoyllysine-residue acetyltransferase [Parvibaculum sp.]